jgi:outer membrane protein OmpA-like peptidoglycan-associated protein
MKSIVGSVALLLPLVVTGCATKGFVRKEIESAKSYTDTRVAEARARADQAWDKASLAERLGSNQYSEVATHQVQFAFDDFRLDMPAQGMLDQLAAQLTAHPHYGLEVRGYADAIGTDRYNYKLGRERADEVYRYLVIRHNVPTNRVATISFGEESPIADNESDEGRAQNRRVQVRVLAIDVPAAPVSVVP